MATQSVEVYGFYDSTGQSSIKTTAITLSTSQTLPAVAFNYNIGNLNGGFLGTNSASTGDTVTATFSTTLGAVCRAAGITDYSLITKVTVQFVACTATKPDRYQYVNAPTRSSISSLIRDTTTMKMYYYNSWTSDTTISNSSTPTQLTKDYTSSFESSTQIKGSFTFKYNGFETSTYYGIDILPVKFIITYNDCSPTLNLVRAKVNSSDSWTTVYNTSGQYGVTLTTSNGKIYVEASATSSCSGTVSYIWRCYDNDVETPQTWVDVTPDSDGIITVPYKNTRINVTAYYGTLQSTTAYFVVQTNVALSTSATAYCTALKVNASSIVTDLSSVYTICTFYGTTASPTTNKQTASSTETSGTYSHTYTGLSINTDYYYRVAVVYQVDASTYNVIKSVDGVSKVTTQTPNPKIIVTDKDENSYTGTQSSIIEVNYPQTLELTCENNCIQSPTYEGSTDGITWSSSLIRTWTTGSGTSAVTHYGYDLVNPYVTDSQTYTHTIYLRSKITVGSEDFYTYQRWRLNPPTITPKCYVTNGAQEYEVDNNDSISVFTTPSGYLFYYKLVSTWDVANNDVATVSRYYEVNRDGSHVATSTGVSIGFTITSGSNYSLEDSYISYEDDDSVEVYRSDNYGLTVVPIVFAVGNLKVTTKSGTINDLITRSEPVATVSGETVTVEATNWGVSNLNLTLTAYQKRTIDQSWSSATQENITLTYVNSKTYTLQPKNTSYIYSVSYLVVATDSVGQTNQSSGDLRTQYFTCSIGVVPIVDYFPDPHIGSVDTTFTADASDSYVMTSESYVKSYEWHIYSDSARTTEVTNDSTIVQKISQTTTDSEFSFKLIQVGVYYLSCTISTTVSSESLSSTWGTVSDGNGKTIIKEITDTGISDYHRFCLVVKKGNKIFVASRERVPYLTNLKFGKNLSNIGTLSCTITGLANATMTDGTYFDDVFDEPNAEVCLLDRMNPVWIGVVTESSEVENNYYNQAVRIKQYNITCYESLKSLATDYIPNNSKGLITGTLSEISRKIIPSNNQGEIGSSGVNYSISLSNTSRLTALDQLYSQAGWRYRCRPNTVVYWNSVGATSPYTITSVLEDKTLKVGSVAVFYTSDGYGCGIVGTYSNNQITLSKSFNIPSVASHVTIYDSYLIDFKPSYYQTETTREWIVNYNATNVEDVKNIRDKFGTVVVYGVGYSGEMIASMMRAWMKINSDYTIDDSMRITKSYDSEIDAVVKLDDVKDSSNNEYSRYTITFNGWSFPDSATLLRLSEKSIYPTVFFVSSQKNLYSMTIDPYPSSLQSVVPVDNNPRRYYDQANNKKTSYIIAVKSSGSGSTIGVSGDMTKKTSIIESLVQLSNVIFPAFSVDKPSLLPSTGSICVGDMKCNVSTIDYLYSEVTITYNTSDWQNTGIPHGHLTDVLVMDNTGSVNYDNYDPDSPYAKYTNVSLTTQGPEGYSIMEMERLACRYMQYGSNYNSQGSCNITVPFFYRNDYEIGCARLPMVGDRIALKKNNVSSSYELQKYEFDLENYSVSIVFGMPILNIGEVIYNMLANSGMSIIPADSSSE